MVAVHDRRMIVSDIQQNEVSVKLYHQNNLIRAQRLCGEVRCIDTCIIIPFILQTRSIDPV